MEDYNTTLGPVTVVPTLWERYRTHFGVINYETLTGEGVHGDSIRIQGSEEERRKMFLRAWR